MATPIQLTANRANALHSTGPRSDRGKAVSARNATRYGLFAAGDFIPEAAREEFEELEAALLQDLAPQRPLEEIWFHQIVSAAWRLRRCLTLEGDEDAEASVQRARSHALNQLARATAELRRLQTERLLRARVPVEGAPLPSSGLASIKEILPVIRRPPAVPDPAPHDLTNQTQSGSPAAPPAPADSAKQTQSTPRNAPCPCGSGQKYKRCCGRNAPAILNWS